MPTSPERCHRRRESLATTAATLGKRVIVVAALLSLPVTGTMLGDYAGLKTSEYRVRAGNSTDLRIGKLAVEGERLISTLTFGIMEPNSGLAHPARGAN